MEEKCFSALSHDNRKRTGPLTINKHTLTSALSFTHTVAYMHADNDTHNHTHIYTPPLFFPPIASVRSTSSLYPSYHSISSFSPPSVHLFSAPYTYSHLLILSIPSTPLLSSPLEFDVDTSMWTQMIAIYSEQCV